MIDKPRVRHMPSATRWEWYAYIDVKVEGLPKIQRLHGFGWTLEGALIGLRESLNVRNRILERHGLEIVLNLPKVGKPAQQQKSGIWHFFTELFK